MSRIGNQPIDIPSGVRFEIKDGTVKIKGTKGSLERNIRPEIDLVIDGQLIRVKGKDNSRKTNAFRGMTRTLINNMIIGVEKGFEKKLVIEGVGYKVKISGKDLELNVGYSNPVKFKMPKNVGVSVNNTEITLDSIDKELLGLTAARIREIRKPEPYKGKGIRYIDEHIVRKVGKTAGKK